jgi:hypothetical protein
MSLETLLQEYLTFRSEVQSEEKRREAIKQTDEYAALQRIIESAQAEQAALLAPVPESSEEFQLHKQALFAEIEREGMTDIPGFTMKTRKKRSVDVRSVLEAMQGDIDNLMVVSSVKMKDLEEFAKANPEYKRDLRKCIVEEGFSVVDLVPDSPSV